jgi:hypothetical protein
MTDENTTGPQGYRFAWCPECGERTRPEQVDSDGCCAECGCTAVGPGIDDLVSRYNHEVELNSRRLVAARTMRDHARGLMRAVQNVRVELSFKCLYCGAGTDSAADMVAHGATCEKHPAVKRMKAIRDAAGTALDEWTEFLSKQTKMTFEHVDIEAATRRLNYVICCDLAMERNDPPKSEPSGQYPDPNRTIDTVVGFFADEVERTVAHQNAPKGGMQVEFNGDFASAPMSTLLRLRWWVREFRDAIARMRKEPTP